MKKIILLLALAMSQSFFALSFSPDSLKTKKDASQNYINHVIVEGEGWLSIARQYKIRFADLRAANSDIDDSLFLSEVIKVPIGGGSAMATNIVKTADKKTADPVTNIIEKKTTETTDSEKLSKKAEAAKTKKETTVNAKATGAAKSEDASDKSMMRKGAREVTELGMASWAPDNNLEPNKYYALHRTAPVGTIIHLTNKANNKSVYCKVIGTLNEPMDSTNLIIKITKLSADKIESKEFQLQCDLKYVVVDEK